ncbi:hypothetical protein [Longimicrobium sp.]|uniref:hypothetical protein n=1 Tax=Longimicrobium sp. TaxID=2029185 RepID=UPI002E376BEC|nr:hypothetical protein [Longimicrobium sp.]HEX6039418.1 hypothetical protein [Longimicrobium sp.]
MKTFLVDLHGGLARLRPAGPLLYPYRADGTLEVMLEAGRREPRELAEAIRASLLRDWQPRVQLIFLVDLANGGLTEPIGRLRAELVGTLAARGIQPARTIVVALDALQREADTGIPEEPAARAAWERDARAFHAEGAPALRDVLVLRFPLRRAPEPVFQQHLVQLVYLVAALVELEEGTEVRRERLYTVDSVALDAGEVRAWMADYARCLDHARRGVEQALAHPEPVELALIKDADCGCSRVLETLEIGQKTYGALRESDDVAGWRLWWQDTGRRLEAHARAGEEVVHGCMRDWRGRDFETTTRMVPSIVDTAAELRERLFATRRALAKETQPRRETPDWETEMLRLTPRVHAAIEARPRPQAFWVFTAAFFVLLTLPLLLAMGRGTAGRVDTAVLVLVGGAGAAWWVLRRLGERLHDETHLAQERGREISKETHLQVDRRKRHLSALCAVEVARRNDAVAQEAARAYGERSRLLKHHQRELAQHRERAVRVAQAAALGAPADGSSSVNPSASAGSASMDADEAPPPPAALQVDQPPHLNAVYAPALCAGIPRDRPYEVRVRSGALVIRRASARLRGLQYVLLGDDILYRPVRGTPAGGPPADAPA